VRCTMAMIVRVRGVEVVCEILDELDQIIDRYGEGPRRRGAGAPSRHGADERGIEKRPPRSIMACSRRSSEPCRVSRRWSRAMLKVEGRESREPSALGDTGFTSRRKPSKRRAREANAAGAHRSGVAAAKALMMTS